MGFFSWLKGAVKNLIGKTEIESALRIQTALSDEMSRAVLLWRDMYHDSPPWKSDSVKTLNLPAVISAKIAKMVTVEAEMTLTGGPRADWLTEQLKPIWGNIRTLTEYAAAKSGLVFKPYLSQSRAFVDCVHADRFFPTAFDSNRNITGGVFAAQKTLGNVIYTRLERHEFKDGVYSITQNAYRSTTAGILGSPCSLSAVPEWVEIQPFTQISNLPRPLFVYWKMPFANNIDDASPLGVSVFSRAAATIEELDSQYSRLIWEFEGGELAVHASQDLFSQKPGGKPGKVILPNGKKRLYRLLDDGLETGKNFFDTYFPAFRDASLLNGFNALLRQIETQCGLAFGTLSDPQQVEKTATEIISAKQESYTTISDIQKSLGDALRQLAISLDALATAGNLAPRGSYEIAFKWDDSIVVDKEARKQQFGQYVSAGKFPFWKYLVEFENYTESEAKALSTEPDMANPFGFQESGNVTA